MIEVFQSAVNEIACAAEEAEKKLAYLRDKIRKLEERIAFERGAPSRNEPDHRLLADLGLSRRCLNALEKIGATTVHHIERVADADLLKVNNFGRSALKELRDAIGRPKSPFVTLVPASGPNGHTIYRLPTVVSS